MNKSVSKKAILVAVYLIAITLYSIMPVSAFELTLCTGDSPITGKTIQIAPTSALERVPETAMKDMFRIPMT